MPHDAKGQLIEVGDEVILRGKVTQVQAGEEYCNISFEAVNVPTPPDCCKSFTTNAALLEKAPVAVTDS